MKLKKEEVINKWEDFTNSTLIFYVNGTRVEDSNVNPEWTLLEYLRKKLHLCGTKLGCGEGGCGACTVMVSRKHLSGIQHLSVNACLAPVCSMHGAAVTTVEGIGNTVKGLHPVQERLAKAHGSQCGFCTPGFVMSMYTLLRNNPKPSYQLMEDYFQGNLCRCTGYRPIMEGYRSFLNGEDTGQQRKGCCQQKLNGAGCESSHKDYQPSLDGQNAETQQNGCCNDEMQQKSCCNGEKQQNGWKYAMKQENGWSISRIQKKMFPDVATQQNGQLNGQNGLWNAETQPNGLIDAEIQNNGWENGDVQRNGWSNGEVAQNGWSNAGTEQNGYSNDEAPQNGWSNVGTQQNGGPNAKTQKNGYLNSETQQKGWSNVETQQISRPNAETQKNGHSNDETQQNRWSNVGEQQNDWLNAGRKQSGCCQQKWNGKCCMENSGDLDGDVTADVTDRLHDTSTYLPYDPTQEPIFPPELQINESTFRKTLIFKGPRVTWCRPGTMQELVELKSRFPDAKLVVGNTELGVETRLKFFHYPVLISTCGIPELSATTVTENGVEIGASVTLSQLKEFLCDVIREETDSRCQIFASILEMLKWFASRQIRNVACLGGNIMTGSPISDLNPILMAAGARLKLRNTNEERTVELNGNFYTGYRRNISKSTEVLVSIFIPFTKDDQYFWCYKQAKRRDDDIAIVNAAFNVTFENTRNTVGDLKASYGGMAPTTVMAHKLNNIAKGRCWDEDLIEAATKALMEEFPLSVDTPGGQVHYRRALTISFFFKFYQRVLMLREQGVSFVEEQSNAHLPEACQVYQKVPSGQPSTDLVGRPIVHKSAFKQVSGEAVYTDDLPPVHKELQAALVQSTQASADILDVDPSKALAMPGVHAFFSAKDLSKENNRIADEEVFASRKVYCQGQVIGLIVADDRLTARRAAREVKVTYAPTKPIITIQEAIDQKSFLNESPFEMGYKDVERELEKSEHILQGEAYVGPQEHFYLEPHAVLATPKEDDEMELIATTQNPTDLQESAAHALGVSLNRVKVSVRRVGGGFGGKETRACMISNPLVVAAKRLNRPVRCVLDRDEDMSTTGGRHPVRAYYKAGCTSEGKITALDLRYYLNAGWSLDLSLGVINRVLLSSDNAYYIPHTRVRAWNCKTNLPSNTAFRGFGSPQAMFVCESILDEVASHLRLPSHEVRRINLYKEGQLSYLGMRMPDNNIRRCYELCLQESQYSKTLEDAEEFNRNNRWRKRGISVVPTKYGIAFGLRHLNQAGVLTHIYRDGSVLISCAGVELGQGLHTKLIQIASRALSIDAAKIYISEVSTDKVPNTIPTAASFTSDLNGMALLKSCQKLMSRLKPVIDDHPKGTWEEWVKQAFLRRISLSATGFYTPKELKSLSEHPETAFLYFTNGAAVSEVEIDCLTGDHEVLSTYIVMDVGKSLNPAIDIGQIEGGWMQGYGMFTMEEPLISPSGFILTRGPGNYKIPSFSDMPKRFNVSLLQGSSNPKAIYSSKAIGEPPLFLASSVFFAIKAAITAARKEAGLEEAWTMDAPATSEKIRLACQDQFTKSSLPQDDAGTRKPWNITV